MKEDERLLLKKLKERGRGLQPSALEISKSINMAYKRARYILRDKWERKGWYDCGVSWRVGWLTRKAFHSKIEA